jgi:hypothetical protein
MSWTIISNLLTESVSKIQFFFLTLGIYKIALTTAGTLRNFNTQTYTFLLMP